MSSVTASSGSFSVKAYAGDFKTLLAFGLDERSAAGLAGFTVLCKPGAGPAYYLFNDLQFETPANHAQDPSEPPNSSINAPYQKFRWLHVPGSSHQGLTPFAGPYAYTVTPRYFDAKGSLEPLDPSLSATVNLNVAPFSKGGLELGFTRGFTQSQAFVHHFGLRALIRPNDKTLLFDTGAESGSNDAGQSFTFADEYAWLGFTARTKIFGILDEVQRDPSLRLDVFAYDLNEPDIVKAFLALAKENRIRIILDNAALHHDANAPTAEDEFEQAFRAAGGGANAPILRGKFGRYSHDKVLIVSKGGKALKVLTGSTNFSVTGLYVNSNHVLIFNDETVAAQYALLFESVWNDKVSKTAFVGSELSGKRYSIGTANVPKTEITFAPHSPGIAELILDAVAERIKAEGSKGGGGSVLFAVMAIDQGTSPVYTALKALHADQSVFSFGISDNPGGIYLYKPGNKTGVLVTGKPLGTVLPPPFDQVPNVGGFAHQVHHKFVVCGFNGTDPVVYCGSSNLALGGEENNGDNLLAIHDEDVATAFAIEALGLVDHFNFLDRCAKGKGAPQLPVANQRQGALDAHWYLTPSDKWAASYFEGNDLHDLDRQLFAG